MPEADGGGGVGSRSPPQGGIRKSPPRGALPPAEAGAKKGGNKKCKGATAYNTTVVNLKTGAKAAENSRAQSAPFLRFARKATLSATPKPLAAFRAGFTAIHAEIGRGRSGKGNAVVISHPVEGGALTLVQLGRVLIAAGEHADGATFEHVVKLDGTDITLKVNPDSPILHLGLSSSTPPPHTHPSSLGNWNNSN